MVQLAMLRPPRWSAGGTLPERQPESAVVGSLGWQSHAGSLMDKRVPGGAGGLIRY